MKHVPRGEGVSSERITWRRLGVIEGALVICFACWMGEADGRFVGGALRTLGHYTSDESDSVLLD